MNSQFQSADSLPTRGSLLAAAISSEPEAWQQLVALYEPRMLRWCRGQGLDPLATSDVIQDAWMSVARGLASFRSQPGAGAFRAWLHQIVRRRIADYRRRESYAPPAVGGSTFAMRVAELPCEGEPRSNTPESDLSISSTTRMSSRDASGHTPANHNTPLHLQGSPDSALHEAMVILQREVEPKTWQAFWLCIVDQRSTDDVAKSLEMTPANVRQCRSRVLRRLRHTIEKLR